MTRMFVAFMTHNGQAAHTQTRTHSHAERTSLERLHSLIVSTAATAPNHFWRYLQNLWHRANKCTNEEFKKKLARISFYEYSIFMTLMQVCKVYFILNALPSMSYKHIRPSSLRLTVTPMVCVLSLLYHFTKNLLHFAEIKYFGLNLLICNLQSYQ